MVKMKLKNKVLKNIICAVIAGAVGIGVANTPLANNRWCSIFMEFIGSGGIR